jgi:hypothetical protein
VVAPVAKLGSTLNPQWEDFVSHFSEGGVQSLSHLFWDAEHTSPEAKTPVAGKDLGLLCFRGHPPQGLALRIRFADFHRAAPASP